MTTLGFDRNVERTDPQGTEPNIFSKLANLQSIIGGFGQLFFNRVSYKTSGLVLLVFLFVVFQFLTPQQSFGSTTQTETNLESPINLVTDSLFTQKTLTQTQILSFATKTVVDETLKEGETKVVQPGEVGKKVFSITITYHNGQEFSRQTSLVNTAKAVTEVIAVAPNGGTVDTPDGKFNYSRKLNVWATSYDATCKGCNEVTAIGLPTGFGVIAVDPKVIPLRSKVYIPGYGLAIAGDTGGKIKGNWIDLGFDDVSNGWWSARYTDIYILAN